MFGQIPDCLDNVWIDNKMNNKAKVKKRIKSLPVANPFALKYETGSLATEIWDTYEMVLDEQYKTRQLMKG